MSSDSDDSAVRVVGGTATGTGGGTGWSKSAVEYDDGDFEKADTTQQTQSNPAHPSRDWVRPPYDPAELANLTELSETHYAAVSVKAQNVAGFGFDLVPHPRHRSDESDEQPPGEDTVLDFWYGTDTDFQLGPDRQPATPDAVLEHGWYDYEAIGWGVLEVLTNESAEPTGLAHIPAHTIRRRNGEPGYVQLDGSGRPTAYFGAAGDRYGDSGDQTFVDAENGEPGDSAAEVGEVANELIVIRNYSPLAPFYGTPDVIPALQTIEGDLAARRYNTTFFENDGVPRFVVLVEGGELTERAWDNLNEKLKALSEPENTGRGIIIEAVSGIEADYEDRHDVTLDIQPLTVGVDEDASFLEFRRENEHDIAKAHRVPEIMLQRTDSMNYASSQSQRIEFAQSVIRPKQEDYAARLYNHLHLTMMDVPGWTLDFHLHGGENEEREATVAKTRAEAAQGTITVNELREELDLPPMEDDNGEALPVGEMLVGEFQQGGTGGGSEFIDEDAVEQALEEARDRERAEQAGYDIRQVDL